jgi:hypothetical protein
MNRAKQHYEATVYIARVAWAQELMKTELKWRSYG